MILGQLRMGASQAKNAPWQYHAIPYIIVTADGAYHWPVGSTWPFFHIETVCFPGCVLHFVLCIVY